MGRRELGDRGAAPQDHQAQEGLDQDQPEEKPFHILRPYPDRLNDRTGGSRQNAG